MNTGKTVEEKEALIKFRKAIQDIKLDWYSGHDDSLLRWLHARELDVDKSEKMIRKHLEWRKDNNIDDILSYEFPDNICKELPFKISGLDNEGSLVIVVPFGQWDMRKFVDSGRKNLLIAYVDYLFELFYGTMKLRSTTTAIMTNALILLDYEGFSMRQITSKQTIELLLQILSRMESNHPEVLKSGFVVNAPRIFEILFKICKPLLTARTLSKIHIFGTNSMDWRSKILSFIPHESMPSQYGGSNTACFNYKMSDGINFKFTKNRVFPESQMTPTLVEAGDKFKVELKVHKENCNIRWSFKTDQNDIGFQLLNENGDKLIECPRADAHLRVQNGTYECLSSGTYTLCFDNSYSRFSSKKLRYAFSIENS